MKIICILRVKFLRKHQEKKVLLRIVFFGLLHGLSSSPYNSSVSFEFFFYSQSVFTSLAWSLARCRLASTPFLKGLQSMHFMQSFLFIVNSVRNWKFASPNSIAIVNYVNTEICFRPQIIFFFFCSIPIHHPALIRSHLYCLNTASTHECWKRKKEGEIKTQLFTSCIFIACGFFDQNFSFGYLVECFSVSSHPFNHRQQKAMYFEPTNGSKLT